MATTPGSIQIEQLSKSFGGVKALEGATVEIKGGEVHGLLGQNGSGKSTLVKCLSGVQSPDSGSVRLWGKPVSFPVTTPARLGIAAIHQDLGLVDSLPVLDNLSVAANYGTGLIQPIRSARERQIYEDLQRQLNLELPLGAPVATLSPPERTFVGVLRALRLLAEHSEHQLFILDEPTTSLTAREAALVTDLMRRVASAGAAVIFISHHLSEVLSVCDTVTVLRDGKVAASEPVAGLSKEDLVERMLGRQMESYYPERPGPPGAASLLEVRELCGRRVHGVTFDVRVGEVLGVTGLTGMGQDELPYLLAGAAHIESGEAVLEGRGRLGRSPAHSFRSGVVLIPANRQRDGVWLGGTAGENITLPKLRTFRGALGLNRAAETKAARESMSQWLVRPPDANMPVVNFSGGNQQKIVLAKWLATEPRLLLLDEPTQGVDAGAKREILQLALKAARDGGGVVIFSGDHEQLAAVCHRVLVMRDGLITAELSGEDLTEAELLAASNA